MSVTARVGSSIKDNVTTAGLVAKIVPALNNNPAQCRSLVSEIESMFATVEILVPILERYHNTSFGQAISHIIVPQVAQYRLHVDEFCANIQNAKSHFLVALFRRIQRTTTIEADTLCKKLSSIRDHLERHVAFLTQYDFNFCFCIRL